MPQSVFISYNHRQADWVRDRLVPILKAGKVEVLWDQERFTAGKALLGQMDAAQDLADVNLLVFSPEYFTSDYCRHEMKRAIALDKNFQRGVVVPIVRAQAQLPRSVCDRIPLYADLEDDSVVAAWDLVLTACNADLSIAAPDWLAARDNARRLLRRGQSLNLVVEGDASWRPLLSDLQSRSLSDLKVVDLEKPSTASRRGLVEEIIRTLGGNSIVPNEPNDLNELDIFISAQTLCRLALVHFDLSAHREIYGIDLFAALRYLVMETRKLVLLIQSRRPFATLLPRGHPLSEIDLKQISLRGR